MRKEFLQTLSQDCEITKLIEFSFLINRKKMKAFNKD
jgi:hypothetical protein